MNYVEIHQFVAKAVAYGFSLGIAVTGIILLITVAMAILTPHKKTRGLGAR